jgi:glycosyltransferase involved in cell wall biosynthesis
MSHLKVVHGTMEIANQMTTIARASRTLGITAATISYYKNFLGYSADFEYILAEQPGTRERLQGTTRVALASLEEFNCFHFWFNTTFALDYSDLPLLKNLDVPRFMHHMGTDVRTLEIAKKMNNKWAVCKAVPPKVIHQQLTTISRYIPTGIVGEPRLYEYVKAYYDKVHMVPVGLDLTEWLPSTDNLDNERPLVVHAPTSPEYKGTKYVLEVVERLRGTCDFDFQLVQNMSHAEAKKVLSKADIIIDQLLDGGHGMLAIEGMAMGKTVITWISEFAKNLYPAELPIVSANPDTLEAQLTKAINEKGLRDDLFQRGPAHVARYHDSHRVAANLSKIYLGEGIDSKPYQTWWE